VHTCRRCMSEVQVCRIMLYSIKTALRAAPLRVSSLRCGPLRGTNAVLVWVPAPLAEWAGDRGAGLTCRSVLSELPKGCDRTMRLLATSP
jgi:hypothetical protein